MTRRRPKPKQCEGVTKAYGEQCQRNAVPGSRYCHTHTSPQQMAADNRRYAAQLEQVEQILNELNRMTSQAVQARNPQMLRLLGRRVVQHGQALKTLAGAIAAREPLSQTSEREPKKPPQKD
jgi:hypothetical protein